MEVKMQFLVDCTLQWLLLLSSGIEVLPKFRACSFQESSPCNHLLVEANLRLLSEWDCLANVPEPLKQYCIILLCLCG